MLAIVIVSVLQVAQLLTPSDRAPRPRLLNAPSLISFEDYPEKSMKRDEYGIVSALLHVSKEGKATSCAVTETSGFPTLDAATCSLAKMRARFDPALGLDGNAVDSDYPYSSAWSIGEHSPKNWKFELPLEVSHIPTSYRKPMQARVIFDASGHMAACETTETSGSSQADAAACAFALQRLTVAAPKSPSSMPPAAVRYMIVSMSIGPASLSDKR